MVYRHKLKKKNGMEELNFVFSNLNVKNGYSYTLEIKSRIPSKRSFNNWIQCSEEGWSYGLKTYGSKLLSVVISCEQQKIVDTYSIIYKKYFMYHIEIIETVSSKRPYFNLEQCQQEAFGIGFSNYKDRLLKIYILEGDNIINTWKNKCV